MEGIISIGKDGEKKHRGRFMGKLFKEKKEPTSQDEVDDFLRGPSDKLHMMPTAPNPSFPPPLARIDTGRSPRWPTAAEVQNSRRRRSTSPKQRRKGLVVRFSDKQPEVIGEGGDEATSPVAEIGVRIRSHTHPPISLRHQTTVDRTNDNTSDHGQNVAEQFGSVDTFRPGPLRRTQTGFDSIPDRGRLGTDMGQGPHLVQASDDLVYSQVSKTADHRRSFADRVKDEMRSGEGLALVKPHGADDELFIGSDTMDASTENTRRLEEVQLNTRRNSQIPKILQTPIEYSSGRAYTPNDSQISGHFTESPAGFSNHSPLERARQTQTNHNLADNLVTASKSSAVHPQSSPQVLGDHTPDSSSLSRTPTLTLQEAAFAVGDDALQEFSTRTAHLFNIFRLSAEAVRPLTAYSLEDLTAAASWWFIKGRLELEATIRDRPSNAEAQKMSFLARQQAYADLSKSLWLSEIIISQRPEAQVNHRSNDVTSSSSADVFDCQQVILSSLRKLAMSMKRNNILPPDGRDVPLTLGLDTSIWVQDDGNRSLLMSQRTTFTPFLSEAFPLGDTQRTFHYSRMFAEATLVEDAAAQQYQCSVLLSIVRNQKESSMSVIIVNQNRTLCVSIQSERSKGTTWNDVRWQAKVNMVEISLPRGFLLRIRFSEQDFRLLWGTHDYERGTHDMLTIQEGEDLILETSLKIFQCFDQSPPSGFSKEPQPDCHLRLFERSVIQKAATGPRKMHRGFRLALNTNPKTKVLRGLDQGLLLNLPIQFGFLRGDGGLPAFLLKIEDGQSRNTLVSTFENIEDRMRVHTLLTGSALGEGEDVVAKAPFNKLTITIPEDSESLHLGQLEWQSFTVINYDEGTLQSNKTVLSQNLRIILNFKVGTLTDRINVGPGELKIRLDVDSQTRLKLFRQAQQDLTLAVSEAQVSKELPKDLAKLLSVLDKSESIRVFEFPSLQELHLFQAAITGFEVLFDDVASSFNISRRRMVVPIYKKWDAASTRLQIVQKEKVIQLVAFFEKFNHGDCMNFTLKSTDVFETSSRSGKFSVRIVDAKFAMPKGRRGETAVDHEFVCLDMPEYPGEHDDITVVFDTEAARDLFTKALPAPPKSASRMGSIRR